jgi:hypothetical protein
VRGGVKLMKKKLIIFCMAVGLSLIFAQTSLAVITYDYDVDPTSLADGHYPSSSPGIISTPYGDIEFVGQIRDSGDADQTGKVFDVDSSRTASLTFKLVDPFKVIDVTFEYGGNKEKITVEALDISDNVLDSLVDAPTGNGDPIGPVTLYGNPTSPGDPTMHIYKLAWKDPGGPNGLLFDLASLNNVTLTIIPAPGAILLGSIGVGLVGWLRRKRTL